MSELEHYFIVCISFLLLLSIYMLKRHVIMCYQLFLLKGLARNCNRSANLDNVNNATFTDAISCKFGDDFIYIFVQSLLLIFILIVCIFGWDLIELISEK